MNQAVSIQTDVAQVLQGQMASVSSQTNNSPLKQQDTDGKASFGQVMADQMASNGEHADDIPVTKNVVETGKVLPVDGKYFPFASINSAKQLENGEDTSTDISKFYNQKVAVDGDMLPDQAAVAAMYSSVSAGLPNPDLLSGSSSLGGGAGTGLSENTVIDTAIPALIHGKLTVNQNPVEHDSGKSVYIDTNMLKPGQMSMTDLQLANQLSTSAKEGDSDVATSLANIDRNVQSEINVGISGSIRRFLNFNNNNGNGNGYPGLYKNGSNGLHSLVAGLQLDGQNVGSTDSYPVSLQQTGQSADLRSPPVFQINQPVTNPQWNNEFADKVRWLVSGNIKKAEISLVPKNLGTIDISISVHNDQTNISINAHNLQSRDVIEGSLARLREMFDQVGFGNVNVDVSQHSNSNSESYQAFAQDGRRHSDQDGDVLTSSIQEVHRDHIRDDALIDLYA